MIETQSISKEVLAAILKGIDEGIHVVDLNGITIFYNEIAARHDGLEVSEVIGKPVLKVFPSLDEETSTLLKVMKTKTPIYNQTQSYVNLHGAQIETINTTLPITVNGKVAGAVEIAKDYSRLKLLSESLLDLRKKIKQPVKKTGAVNNVQYTFDSLLTINKEMKNIKKEAAKLAKSDSSILVFGESGCGKELFVQGLHHASSRTEGPFIAQNCAAIPESLLESILFGTAKGGYTGAVDRPGLFELADGGTLFLDEIHAMPIELQAKLLRVLEDGIVRRVGSPKSSRVNVRVIAAMNIHPVEALEKNQMRKDLFYRLNVLTFGLLPLRERKEDIEFLAHHFIKRFNQVLNKSLSGIGDDVLAFFRQYHWPGNVRELKHTIEYMMNVCEQDFLKAEDLPVIMKQQLQKNIQDFSLNVQPLKASMEKQEKALIEKALQETNGNIKKAAKLLEVPRQTLQYKLAKYNIEINKRILVCNTHESAE
ncbi:sigma-54 interaction domain-containing protein [Cytobacillus firmus]|uniref:Arginine utilization regulatory protein RocR n=1 Tax=Cytobacillus firmus TaxID=1399 RepID=A0A380XVH8_CYTFI|nr:sigma 54-interacting transcriptional regulator [Cytobacillus firmus]KAF0826111.1 Arginine utilization regulatory protein RocR [Cytobacillus firmus]MBG9542753.1 ATPase AAA [Cytobacillus firmus]MBG9551417.1 ATPase AAA [Cytobacillus firmus]MBG9555844.1 ATPase AAA [Cytobacillus firmus]MBG9574046.1 ATPase AAA [Cytobacillus firmus]